MIDPNLMKNLLHKVEDQDSLVDLLKTREESGGLGWPVDADAPFQLEPEIAAGVKGDGQVSVSRLIPAAADEGQLILLAEFERLPIRRDLRELLSSVRRHIRTTGRFEDHTGFGDTVFIVAAPGYEDVRFVLFEERERKQARIRSFGWRKESVGRTVLTHNLGRLRWSDRLLWEKAWDVEGLTDEFYNEFVKVFDAVKAAATHPGGEEKKHAYVQQLLNRLLFIAFIERMGWLKTPEGDSDYLHLQWLRFQNPNCYEEVQDKLLIPATFNELLEQLFFSALNDQSGVKPNDRLYTILGEVPYLNGGLFSRETDLDVSGVTVADEVFELILGDRRAGSEGGLFRRFNFTVTESTPLDQEVAVDPEMLGTIFERLVTGRHETGAYYTPRQVVAFMVKQALWSYLERVGLPPEKAGPLVEFHEVIKMTHPEIKLSIEALRAVRAVDPACGSGAYLMGLHQALFDIIDALVLPFEGRNPSVLYHRKLRLLQDTIYGVDIDLTAVRIARLRLWLSLVVENHGQLPEPLPYLDFKIEHGDSLTFPVQRSKEQSTSTEKLLEDFTQAKIDSDDPDYDGSRGTQAERRSLAFQLRADLRSFYPSQGVHAFNWKAEFFEVLGEGRQGFDIVLANPPYVRADAQFKHLLPDKKAQQNAIREWKEYRESLKASKVYETLHEKWDLYIPFLERAHQLLCPGGQMVFIIPDAYNGNKYALKSHTYFLANSAVERIDFCSDIPLFTAKVSNTILHLSKKIPPPSHIPVRARRWGNKPSDFEPNCEIFEALAQSEAKERIFRLLAERNIEVTGDFVPLAHVCYISVGAVLHANEKTAHEAFKLEDLIADQEDAEHPKRLFMGRNMGHWTVNGNSWLEYGTMRAPKLFRRPTFPELYEVPAKIVSMDLSGATLRAIYDNRQCWHNHSAWSFVPWHYLTGIRNNSIQKTARYKTDKKGSPRILIHREELEELSRRFDIRYILGLMNSSFARGWIAKQRGNKMHIYPEDWKPFPVRHTSHEEQMRIANLVQNILDRKEIDFNADVSDLEAEIDSSVEFLYFHADQAATYDEWIAKQEAERGTVIEEIWNLVAKGENEYAEFKESVVWDVRQDKHSTTMRDEVLKEICAFLNADGGTILCGVHDTEGIKGLRKDLKHAGSPDKLGLVITNALGDLLRPHPVELVKMRFIEIDGETILRIDVQSDPTDRYESPSTRKEDVGKNLPRTHVRIHGSAKALEGQDLINWWSRRQR